MKLRAAGMEDVESIVQILSASRREYLPYAPSPHTLDGDRSFVRKRLIPTGGVVLAQLAGEDVGVLATSESDGFGWVDQLYLAPGYIRQGIGGALLAHAFDVLPRPIRLWTFQENERAIAFYKHHGFVAVKFTDGKNNDEQCPDILFELT